MTSTMKNWPTGPTCHLAYTVRPNFLGLILFFFISWLSSQAFAAGPMAVQVVTDENQVLSEVTVYLGQQHAATNSEGIAIFDNMPAGPTELKILHPNYDKLLKQVDIPAKEREPLMASLTASKTLNWTAQVVMSGLEQKVAGAQVNLTPLAVAATLSGPVTIVSDWEGNLYATDLAVGLYDLAITAPGYEPFHQKIEVDTKKSQDNTFALQRQKQPVAVQIKVQDQAGTPIDKAQVCLAEVWPVSVVANATTNPQGMVDFDSIATGNINAIDENNALDICRQTLTVRVEAPGYLPNTSRLSLDNDLIETTVALTPQSQTQLQGPNLSQPTAIIPGIPVSFAINTQGQYYPFVIHLDEPALLHLTIAEGTPIETTLRLKNSQGDLIKENNAYSGNPNIIEQDLAAGEYHIEVREWGDNAASPEPLILLATLDTGIDPLEPNDSFDAASLLLPDQVMTGRIWPKGDRDIYAIDLERPGFLRVHDHGHPLERHVIIHNEQQELIGEQKVYSNNPLNLIVQTQPGIFYIEIQEWGNNGESLVPYRIHADIVADDGLDDPVELPDIANALRDLPLPGQIGSTILPVKDVDVFRVQAPGAGRIHVQSNGRIERHMRLVDSTGNVLVEQKSYADNKGQLSYFVEEAGTYYLHLTEWGDNHWSPDAYALSAWFEPADMFDFVTRNDDMASAIPVSFGSTIHGSYMPKGDQDFFVVDVDFPGHLRVSAQSTLETHLRILGPDGSQQAEAKAYADNIADVTLPVLEGQYYIVIGEWGDNDASVLPYSLSIDLDRAEPEETIPLADDPPRVLQDGEARSFSIDHKEDRDRFLFTMPQTGEVTIHSVSPLEQITTIYDHHSNELLWENKAYAPAKVTHKLSLDKGTTLRIEVNEWGDDKASLEPGFILADTQGRNIQADKIVAKVNPETPKIVTFYRESLAYADSPGQCVVDLYGDGKNMIPLMGDEPAQGEFKTQGVHAVQAVCTGSDGQTSRQSFWVQATGYDDDLSEPPALDVPATIPPEDQAVSLYKEAMKLQASGDYAGALSLYQKSFALNPDPKTEDRIKKLEVYLGHKRWDGSEIPPALTPQKGPDKLDSFRNNVGETFLFTITGAQGGRIWGGQDGLYTDDSHLGTTVVHHGLLKVGETGNIYVKILPGQSSYPSISRNGITSIDYGSWGGSYKLLSKAAK